MGQQRKEIYSEMYEDYLAGFSMQKIAEKYHISRQSVFKAFKIRGFQLRGPNFRPYQIYDGMKFTLRNTGYYSLSLGDRKLMHRYVYEKEVGPIPEGYDIHHINEDKSDNRIENLECLSKADHTRLYSPHNNQYTKGRKRETNKPV